jgi:hypothetical protein
MSRKNWAILAVVATLGMSSFFVAKAVAAVDPYAPTTSTTTSRTATVTVTTSVRPPVRDPLRPPTRSPFVP